VNDVPGDATLSGSCRWVVDAIRWRRPGVPGLAAGYCRAGLRPAGSGALGLLVRETRSVEFEFAGGSRGEEIEGR